MMTELSPADAAFRRSAEPPSLQVRALKEFRLAQSQRIVRVGELVDIYDDANSAALIREGYIEIAE
jgi:hypothetical protein